MSPALDIHQDVEAKATGLRSSRRIRLHIGSNLALADRNLSSPADHSRRLHLIPTGHRRTRRSTRNRTKDAG
jgi:hypothetical protein